MSEKQTRVHVINEVVSDPDIHGEVVCLQKALYDFGNGGLEIWFRFIKRDIHGNLKAQRGQAGIEDLTTVEKLLQKMRELLASEGM